MSSFKQITRHPVTGVYSEAEYLDDYFGPHFYGVKFPEDEKVYPQDYVDRVQIKTFWMQDVVEAVIDTAGFSASPEKVIAFLNEVERQYKARWKRDPIGGEGAVDYLAEHII